MDGGIHSSNWHNIMTGNRFMHETDPNLVILDDIYKTVVRSLAVSE